MIHSITPSHSFLTSSLAVLTRTTIPSAYIHIPRTIKNERITSQLRFQTSYTRQFSTQATNKQEPSIKSIDSTLISKLEKESRPVNQVKYPAFVLCTVDSAKLLAVQTAEKLKLPVNKQQAYTLLFIAAQ